MFAANPHRNAFAPDPWNVYSAGPALATDDSERLPPGASYSRGGSRLEPSGPMRIGEILVGAGVISVETRDRVLEYQRWNHVSFGTALLETGAMSEHLFLRALSVQSAAPLASEADLAAIPPEVLALVKRRIVERHLVIPFRKVGRTLHVAMARPNDNPAIRPIALLTGLTVVPHVAIAVRVALAIEKHYGVPASPHFKEVAKVLDEMAAAASRIAPAAQAAHDLPNFLTAVPAPPSPPADSPARDGDLAAMHAPGVPVRNAPGPETSAARPQAAEQWAEAPESPLLWAQLTRGLSEAQDFEQMATVLLDVLREAVGPVAIYLVHGDDVVLWRSRPASEAPARILSIPCSQSLLFESLRDTGNVFAGPCPDSRTDSQILASVGGRLPANVVAVPVGLNGRTVLYIVGRPEGEQLPLGRAGLSRLASIAATALELDALRRRFMSL